MLQSHVQNCGIWHSECKSLSHPLQYFWDIASIHKVLVIGLHGKGSILKVFVQILSVKL